MEDVPGIISDRLRELRGEHSCKIGMNEPTRVVDGTLYVPYYDTKDGNAPDEPLPILLIGTDGSFAEVYGLPRNGSGS